MPAHRDVLTCANQFEGEMDVALSVIKYLFVTTVMVGGAVVAAAIVRLAWEKARQPQVNPKDDA